VLDDHAQGSRRDDARGRLWERRDALRHGHRWLEAARRDTTPDSSRIAPERWPELRPAACGLMNVPADGRVRFQPRVAEDEPVAQPLDQQWSGRRQVRIDAGAWIVSPLEAEARPASADHLEAMIVERWPRLDLPTLLIEVESGVHGTRAFTHAGGRASRHPERWPTRSARLLAQRGNVGLTQRARMSEFSPPPRLWTTHWSLREATLKAATTTLVHQHEQLPWSRLLGGGMRSASDGQRCPVAVDTAKATALPRYFGDGRGLTF
jgi:hypothetical protein